MKNSKIQNITEMFNFTFLAEIAYLKPKLESNFLLIILIFCEHISDTISQIFRASEKTLSKKIFFAPL